MARGGSSRNFVVDRLARKRWRLKQTRRTYVPKRLRTTVGQIVHLPDPFGRQSYMVIVFVRSTRGRVFVISPSFASAEHDFVNTVAYAVFKTTLSFRRVKRFANVLLVFVRTSE